MPIPSLKPGPSLIRTRGRALCFFVITSGAKDS